ncbi:MAG: ActS/PrrB/RegB family redox-sensitive histidine kinase [Maritimibacter sp.]|jgi:two-component system, sensor histidine kinase RegB
MAENSSLLLENEQGNSWVRLRTLIMLRWFAVFGQIAAIALGEALFELDIERGYCAMAIGLSVSLNLFSQVVFPESKRLSQQQTTMFLAFDTVQLAILLGLTGGINNPFALMILAPITVAATALSLRSVLVVGEVAIVALAMIAWFHLPLVTTTGELLEMPQLFALGYWVAIVVAIVFIGIYTRRVSSEIQSMSRGLLATQMALAREQKLTDLGGVVAAAAHELGTPLATIKLVSSEMVGDLPEGSELREDAELIRDQADRCRDILHSMGRSGKDDLHLHQALLGAVIEEAAEPHHERGKVISIETADGSILPESQPMVRRRPELVHGLRNLIQNAVDFASSQVWVETCWSPTTISIKIIDDGTGYPPHLLGKIGDPFISKGRKSSRDARRPEYEGMGLGLFIAKTLLERTGAELNFANGSDPYTGEATPGKRTGAIVEVVWQRGPGSIEATERLPVLSENVRFES